MIAPEAERNLGFFTEEEQMRLGTAVVAIAGAGGDGGELALSLARLGIGAQGGEIRLADPDTFERENINRQACCTTRTVGMNKAVAVAEYIREINPDIKVTTYTEGITRENTESFVAGSDLLVDETEFTMHAIGIALARTARHHNVPNLQVINVGFGAQVTSYDAQGKYTMERRLGVPETMPLGEVAEQGIPVTRWLAELPSYGDLGVFEKVAKGEKSAPSVVTGVNIAAGIASVQAILHLLGPGNHRPEPVYAPQVLSVDAMTGKAHHIRFPRLRVMVSMAGMALRSKLGLNPRAGY
ncbi:MAG TPA: ThiF family adenylyltransferase [Candidatus Saccharimonadales bacterium]|nr:ThiF family adenylyltransferase [Candidatus Saccharimonadales bacterium]